MSEMTTDDYIAACFEKLQEQTKIHSDSWGLGRCTRWDVDMSAGLITWSFEDDQCIEAEIQVIGTYNPADGTFLWAWAHPSVPKELQAHAELVKKFGEEFGIEELSTPKIQCSVDDAWKYTAIAYEQAEADGAYSGDAGGPRVFVTFQFRDEDLEEVETETQ